MGLLFDCKKRALFVCVVNCVGLGCFVVDRIGPKTINSVNRMGWCGCLLCHNMTENDIYVLLCCTLTGSRLFSNGTKMAKRWASLEMFKIA